MVWKLSPFCIPEGFFDIGEDGRTQTAWHVKCPGLSSAFFCIFLVVSVPKNTNLLGWYLTSRIGCLVEVLNCYSIYLCIDIHIHINICIYIYILYVYIVYTHYIHILLMYRKERLVDFCRNLPMRRIGAYSQCTSQNRSVSLVANLAAVKSATYFLTQGWVSFKKKTCEPCETM